MTCNTACAKCYGQNSNQCTECADDFFFNKDENLCSTICPFGTYKNSSAWECTVCNITCESCDGQGGSSCLSCSNNLFLDQKQCLSKCITARTYGDLTTHKCQPCNIACMECDGPTAANCSACDESKGYYLYDIKHTCVTLCPTGLWADTASKTCISCTDCKTCGTDRDYCLSCYPGTFLELYNTDDPSKNNKCTADCFGA